MGVVPDIWPPNQPAASALFPDCDSPDTCTWIGGESHAEKMGQYIVYRATIRGSCWLDHTHPCFSILTSLDRRLAGWHRDPSTSACHGNQASLGPPTDRYRLA